MSKRSELWLHFNKSKESAECKYCKSVVKTSGNTTNLKQHLQRKHPTIMKVGNDENESSGGSRVIKDFFEHEHEPQQSASDSGSDLEVIPSNSSQASGISLSQPTITKCLSTISDFKDGGCKAGKIKNAILYMIAKDDLPLSTVEKEGFKYLMATTTPLYKIPCRTTMGNMVEEKYHVLAMQVRQKLSKVNWISLTTDIWTDSLNTCAYLGLTCHYVDLDLKKICTIALGVNKLSERHDAEYLSTEIISMCAKWDIPLEKICCITTDNASNIVKAAQDVFGKDKHLGCFAHNINLIASKPFHDKNSIPIVKDVVSRVKDIVSFFHHSVVASDELKKIQDSGKELKLIQSVVTRWNSVYYQLERFVTLSSKVALILLKHSRAPPMLNASEMNIVEDLILILKPLEILTKEVSAEKHSTASLVLPLINCLKQSLNAIKPNTVAGIETKKTILQDISTRYKDIEKNKIIAISTILNPKFKKIHFQDAILCSQAVSFIKQMITGSPNTSCSNFSSDEEDNNVNSSIWHFHTELAKRSQTVNSICLDQEKYAEIQNYLRQPVSGMKIDPIQFWCEQKSVSTTNLWEIAIRYHTIMCTSVPCERLFSLASNILTSDRNRLQKLDKLLLLKSLDFESWHL